MMNGTDDLFVHWYEHISEQLTKYFGTLLYTLCLFGTIMNIGTFSQQMYHRRACSLYLLMASICDFVYLNLESLFNILQYGFHYHWCENSLFCCKTRSYFGYISIVTSGMLTISASITQYLLTSKENCRWYYARRHIGIRCVKLIVSCWLLASVPVLICSTRFYHGFQSSRLVCSKPIWYLSCHILQVLYICIFNGFLPPLIMLMFGFLAYKNIHHRHQRSTCRSTGIRRINKQLIFMLILQAAKSGITSLPYSMFNCYWLSTLEIQKSLLLQAKENLIHQISYLLFWSNYTSFFIYVGSSNIFRQQWIEALKQVVYCRYGERQREYLAERRSRAQFLYRTSDQV